MSGILILCILSTASMLPHWHGSDTILSKEMGLQPEILVTAPRYKSEEADSIGTMPGIIVYGERYEPESEQKLIISYENYRNLYNAAVQFIVKYGVYLAIGIAAVTWGVITYSRFHSFAHEPTVHHVKKKDSALHKYYKRCQKNKEQWYVL